MRSIEEYRLKADGHLRGTIDEPMIARRRSMFAVSDVVDMLTEQLGRGTDRPRAFSPKRRHSERLAAFVFGNQQPMDVLG